MSLDKLKDPMFPWQKIEDVETREAIPFLIKRPYDAPFGDVVIQVSVFEGRMYPDAKDACIDWEDGIENALCWMPLDTPEKLAQALKIAVEALEEVKESSDYYNHNYGECLKALKQIEEVLK